MLAVSTWLWGDKYSMEDVRKLREGVRRHLKQPHRFLLMTERERTGDMPDGVERHAIKDPHLLAHKGCFARLRMFDPGWQHNRNIDDRLVCLDLDAVVVAGLDDIFDRPEPFVILAGANSMNPCPFNGSVMMLRPGAHPELFTDFDIAKAHQIPCYKFPDDQGWIAQKVPKAATWMCGRKSGIYGFQKPGWPHYTEDLPPQARLVVFPGERQVKDYVRLKWVRDNWR